MKNFLNILRISIRDNLILRTFFAYKLTRTPLFDIALYFYRREKLNNERTNKLLSSPDLLKIDRTLDSGKIRKGIQTLHHDIRVIAGSYYGPDNALMMEASRGVHEPQEEWAYSCILDRIKKRYSGSQLHILELGAFWGFYSIWFLKQFSTATALLIEPDAFNIISGEKNTHLNQLSDRVRIKRAFVATNPSHNLEVCPTISVDSLGYVERHQKITILHSDIQGYEVEMLDGAQQSLNSGLVDYVFISTHSDKIHSTCLNKLIDLGFMILAEHNMTQSFSDDGLIVAASPQSGDTELIDLSKREVSVDCKISAKV